jgi:hypothetical protein
VKTRCEEGDTHVARTNKLKPQDRKAKHGLYSLAELLKGEVDGRYYIAKQRDQLEAMWLDYCGGKDVVTPAMLSLIKRIVHQELFVSHAEKMFVLGRCELSDKNIISVVNSQRLNVMALQNLLANHSKLLKKIPTIEDLVQEGEDS